ncbi:MAG: hypothetical protein ACRCWQ_13265 [Bacilli bacterium]
MSKQIQQLKQQYEQQPVPDNLNEVTQKALLRGMQVAKQKQKIWKRWTAVTATIATAACASVLLFVNPVLYDSVTQSKVLKPIAEGLTLGKLQSTANFANELAPVPQAEGYTLQSENKATQREMPSNESPSMKDELRTASGINENVEVHVSEKTVSIKVVTPDVVPTTSSSEVQNIYTIDVASERILTLSDIFNEKTEYVTILNEVVKSSLVLNDTEKYTLLDTQPFYFNENNDLVLLIDIVSSENSWIRSEDVVVQQKEINDLLRKKYVKN